MFGACKYTYFNSLMYEWIYQNKVLLKKKDINIITDNINMMNITKEIDHNLTTYFMFHLIIVLK